MFRRAVVIDVITHPNRLTDAFINLLDNDQSDYHLHKKKNKNFLKKLPRNAIIASFIQSKQRFIALPFFSSHIGFPLKPNEEVWIFEDPSNINREDDIEYFWMTRVHGLNLYEDANYSHPDRKYFTKNNLKNNIKQIDQINEIVVPQFNNGPVRDKSFETANRIVEELQKNNNKQLNISGEYLLEDVPRVTKNPGDFILQGSNNTLIKLGTNSSLIKSNDNINQQYNSNATFNKIEPYSGAIDIVAGRAAISQSAGIDKKTVNYIKNDRTLFTKSVATRAYKNSLLPIYNEKGYTENVKDSEYYLGSNLENVAEGDSDFFTDVSRLLISEYSAGDQLLNYSPTFYINEEGNQLESSKNRRRGFIIAKSDEIRLVARREVISRNRYNVNKLEYNDLYEPVGGSIKIIKEGFDDLSYINLEENGSIAIDASMIVIGDKKRAQDNGLGNNIFLGNNAVDPVVLGFKLKQKLENLIEQVVLGFNQIASSLNSLVNHGHTYAGPAGITQGPTLQPSAPGQLTYMSDYIISGDANLGSALIPDNIKSDSTTRSQLLTGEESSEPINAANLVETVKNINAIKQDLNKILSTMVKTN